MKGAQRPAIKGPLHRTALSLIGVTACAEAATWPIGIKVSINLSAVQFRKNNLVDIVICALAQSGLPIISANNMAEAAQKVVAAARGQRA